MDKPTRRARASQTDPEVQRVVTEFWDTFDQPADRYVVEHTPPPTVREAYLEIYGRPLGGASRQFPRPVDKERIRERQGNRCLYCDELIGSLVLRRNEPIELRTAWDHFIPYAYAQRNGHDNWVLACHLCNLIKHAKMFQTVMEAQQFIQARWVEKRIERLDPALQAVLMRERMAAREITP